MRQMLASHNLDGNGPQDDRHQRTNDQLYVKCGMKFVSSIVQSEHMT